MAAGRTPRRLGQPPRSLYSSRLVCHGSPPQPRIGGDHPQVVVVVHGCRSSLAYRASLTAQTLALAQVCSHQWNPRSVPWSPRSLPGLGASRRGVSEPAASLTVEAGIAVFKVAFDRWITGGGRRILPRLIRDSLEELRVVTAGR